MSAKVREVDVTDAALVGTGGWPLLGKWLNKPSCYDPSRKPFTSKYADAVPATPRCCGVSLPLWQQAMVPGVSTPPGRYCRV